MNDLACISGGNILFRAATYNPAAPQAVESHLKSSSYAWLYLMNYGCSWWQPESKHQANRLERLQQIFHKLVVRDGY